MVGVRVSACLIVRDEERFTAGCLGSIRDQVDEMIVVDTGSRDNTIEIARSFGATVIERQWRNDFAWARNEGLAQANGDWILYIDADERLVVPEGADLRRSLSDPDAYAALVHFRPTVNGTPFREYRLFRNDPRIRFKGSMHETILPDIEALQASIGAKVARSDVEIVHLGYEVGSEWKHQRNLPLLRQAIVEDPHRLYYRYHLAVTLTALGRTEEALEVGRDGMARARLTDQTGRASAIAALLAHTHAQLLHGRGDDALPVIADGFRFYARNPSLRLLEAQVLIARGRHVEALPILDELASIDPASYRDDRLSHDQRIFTVYAPDLLGVVFLRLGRRQDAAAAFARAARNAPDELSYRIKAQALGATNALVWGYPEVC